MLMAIGPTYSDPRQWGDLSTHSCERVGHRAASALWPAQCRGNFSIDPLQSDQRNSAKCDTHPSGRVALASHLASVTRKYGRLVEGIRQAKISYLAKEARSLHASDFSDFLPPKRFTLLICLIHQATITTRDEIVQMFIKRMSKLTTKAKEELERLRKEDRTTTERLIDVFTEVLQTNTETPDVAEAGKQIRKVLDDAGGTAQLLEQCEQVSAHHGDRYQPLVWRFYSSHRKALFSVIKTLDLSSTTSDQALIDAMNFIIAHEHDPKKYLEATHDLSFASAKWQRTVMGRRKSKSWHIRQHLETCVFSYVAEELKTGDLCVAGSKQFADYCDQLLSWEECEPKLAEYCQRLNFPTTVDGFVEHLRTFLTEVAVEVDRTRPQNHELVLGEKGELALKKLRAKATPASLAQLEEALHEKIPAVFSFFHLSQTIVPLVAVPSRAGSPYRKQ